MGLGRGSAKAIREHQPRNSQQRYQMTTEAIQTPNTTTLAPPATPAQPTGTTAAHLVVGSTEPQPIEPVNADNYSGINSDNFHKANVRAKGRGKGTVVALHTAATELRQFKQVLGDSFHDFADAPGACTRDGRFPRPRGGVGSRSGAVLAGHRGQNCRPYWRRWRGSWPLGRRSPAEDPGNARRTMTSTTRPRWRRHGTAQCTASR